MPPRAIRSLPSQRSRLRSVAAVLAVSVLVALAALAPAGASASPRPLPAGGISEAPEGLAELLGEAPLGTGGVALSALEPTLLARLIDELPGISELNGVSGLGGKSGVEATIGKAIKDIVTEQDELEELVGSFGLAFALEERLESHEAAVESALGRSLGEVIDEGLESLTVSQLLSRLLAHASHPSEVAAALFAAAEAEELEELLGAAPSGEPFAAASVSEVAGELLLSPAELAAKLSQSSAQLPGAALALLQSLNDGHVLGVFAASDGLVFGLIGSPPPSEEPPETEAAGPGPAPAPGAGTSAGAGATGTTSTPLPGPGPAATTPGTTAAATAPAASKIKILSHRIRGASATVVLQLPGAGRLTLRGSHLKTLTRTTVRAARVRIRINASSPGLASLRRHHRLKVKLQASFKPDSGSPSSATLSLELQ